MAEEVPTVLVSGASGFIGTHIVKQLLESGQYKVRGTVRSLQNEEKVVPVKNLCPDSTYPLELVEADLCDEKSWINAVKGCTYVIHSASPFPKENPKNEDEVIKPAIEGTVNILKACIEAGCVKRAVLTSSAVAVFGGLAVTGTYSEANWPVVDDSTQTYPKSKILAEKAAWSLVQDLPDDKKFELVVLNPNFVVGPVLCGSFGTSQEIAKSIIEHSFPALPKIHFHTIDVRDVARAHINALTVPEAAGHRHLLFSGGGWFKEFGLILDQEFRQYGYNVVTREAPNFVIKLTALFDQGVRMIVPGLGKRADLNSDRMSKVLGINEPIELKQSLIDMVYSMIEAGKIKKAKGYKGQPSLKL